MVINQSSSRSEAKILCVNSHERLVVVSNLEDVEIVLGVYEVLDRAVLVRHGHHAGQVLQEELQLATQVSIDDRYLEATGCLYSDLAQAPVGVADFEDTWVAALVVLWRGTSVKAAVQCSVSMWSLTMPLWLG